MKMPLSGGCRCRRLSWSCGAAPNFTVNCSCRACQLISGAPYVSALNVQESAVSIVGEVRRVTRVGGSGEPVVDGFCAACGSRVFSWSASRPGTVGIMATSLDDGAWFVPMLNIFAAQAPRWHIVDRSIPTFDSIPGG